MSHKYVTLGIVKKKYRNIAQENSRTIRIPLVTYNALRQTAAAAQVSIGQIVESLAKLQSWTKPESKPMPKPTQITFISNPIESTARSMPVKTEFTRGVESGIRYRKNDSSGA